MDLDQKLTVRISHDEMQGFVSLKKPDLGEEYVLAEVLKAIGDKGIHYGLKQEELLEMIQKGIYNSEHLIAEGFPAKDGADGFYQMNFNLDFNNKPTVRADGSVDYWCVHVVEIVEEGQVIAVYHEPVAGENGMTVGGKPIMAKRGRPLPPMTGKGFSRSEDGKTYTADITGKIEMVNNRIQILPVYEVYGDVDLTTGNIDFRGDVIIHGNVTTGSEIKATGTITIDGIVEAATLIADKDIILRGGVLGKGKAEIRSKANITAKFLEYATIECEGCLEASSALDCNIKVHDKLLMEGTNSVVVGGCVYAARGIDLYTCGNDSEIRTELQVGVDKVMMAKLIALQDELAAKNMMFDRVNQGLEQFAQLAEEKAIDPNKDERRLGLLRARIATQADINKLNEQINYYDTIIEGARGATVRILSIVNPGVQVTIDNITAQVREPQREVEFIVREGKVIMIPVSY